MMKGETFDSAVLKILQQIWMNSNPSPRLVRCYAGNSCLTCLSELHKLVLNRQFFWQRWQKIKQLLLCKLTAFLHRGLLIFTWRWIRLSRPSLTHTAQSCFHGKKQESHDNSLPQQFLYLRPLHRPRIISTAMPDESKEHLKREN
jgi:hypothetical protein